VTMTPEAIMRELEEWTGISDLKKRLGFKEHVDLRPTLKEAVKAGLLEERYADSHATWPKWKQWQVRRKGAGQ